MGQKVHPIGMRVGVIRDWDAKWYADKNFAEYLHEDLAIRKFLYKKLKEATGACLCVWPTIFSFQPASGPDHARGG